MRKELKNINEQRKTFIGIFERRGIKNGFKKQEETVLLIDIRDLENNMIAQHLWFNLTKGFEKLELKHGDKVQFDAKVKKYQKGYLGRREDVHKSVCTDYKLSHPTKLKKL